ncbi:MAG: biotin--[acetyl-CoA-carboxylase] ligase [Chlamydiia bacterium]|nr:biotin--[acetyl-CoA-carboxylase] ligase [Chlamydiia bacterium]
MRLNRLHFPTLDSTNKWSKEHLHQMPKREITLITADCQTAGKGQFRRKWLSPPGVNIYASFCFFIDHLRPDIGHLTQVMALGIVKTAKQFSLIPRIKWPNDIYLDEKKCAGVLCETTPIEKVLGVIVGVGINVNTTEEVLSLIDQPATSFALQGNQKFRREEILDTVTHHFIHDLPLFLKHGFDPFKRDFDASVGR